MPPDGNPETWVLAERIKNLSRQLEDVERRYQLLEKELGEMRDDMAKARGGFFVLVAVGSVIAFAAGAVDKVYKWFHS